MVGAAINVTMYSSVGLLRNKTESIRSTAQLKVNIWFEYDIEIHAELDDFKGSESKINSFDSVFLIDSANELIRIANHPALAAGPAGLAAG